MGIYAACGPQHALLCRYAQRPQPGKNLPRRKHALREVENAITALEANKIVDADKSIDIALKQLEEAAGADKRPRGPRRK